MHARSRWIELCGAQVETPLLVPAISSKAIGPIPVSKGRGVALEPASKVHTDTYVRGIDESVLISAYDIHYDLVSDSEAFHQNFERSLYAVPRVLFIDCGWYEKGVGPAAGQWYHEVGDSLKFELSDYTNVIESLDPTVRAVLVSWDCSGPYQQQIETAQRFFSRYPRFNSDILLKPERVAGSHNFGTLSTNTAERLRAFAVVGVTEKELGDTVLGRLKQLASLRQRLDEAEVDIPIHVFGGLDPLAMPLYFAVGGEIFDGLEWLRYEFRDGLAIYRDAAPLLDRTYDKRYVVSAAHVQLKNLDAMAEMRREMKVFHHNDGDWSKLRRGDMLKPAFEALEAAMGKSRGR